ncbi:hypothetical protein KI387_015552, partial [Taxus chinensis]
LMSKDDLGIMSYRAGKKLEQPPHSKNVLLDILEEAEICLSMVEQSDSEIMQYAVNPSMTHLAMPELLRHPNPDVRLVLVKLQE